MQNAWMTPSAPVAAALAAACALVRQRAHGKRLLHALVLGPVAVLACSTPPARSSPPSSDLGAALDPAAATPVAGPPREASGGGSLHARLGGTKGVEAVAFAIATAVVRDPGLAKRFEHANLPRFRAGLAAWLDAAAGGPTRAPGAPLQASHAGMGVSNEEHDAFVAAARRGLADASVSGADADEVVRLLERTRAEVVAPRPSASRELRRVEARLASVERTLREVLARLPEPAPRTPGAPSPTSSPSPSGASHASASTPGPAAPSAPSASSGAALLPPPLPDPAHLNPAFRGPKWTPDEKALAPALVQGFRKREQGEPPAPSDLVGDRLPETRFLSATGGVVDLAAFEGKQAVVLVVLRGFAGSICLHCSAQVLALTDARIDLSKRKCQVVLVYPGHRDSVPAFLQAVKALEQSYKPAFPILLDEDLAFTRALGIEGGLAKPTTLVVDRSGLVRFAHVGQQPADRPSVAELLRVLDQLTGEGS